MNESDLVAGRYQRIQCIGTGGHGSVWEARDTLSDTIVAVKLLKPEIDFSPARSQLEVGLLRLRLPGVVELHDDGVYEGRPFIAMELVRGTRFPGCPIPCAWAQIADVTAALLETLSYVHAASIVHRDLKPENVLVTSERRIKVLDFGIAVRIVAEAERFTQTPQVMGTPAYVAQEQVRGEADRRADLFAVGVMLYEALSGKLPFGGATIPDVLRSRKQRPPPLAQVAPDAPPIVAQVVERLLAYDPEQRPRSAEEVLHMLRGEPSVEAPHFPWLGPQATLRAVVRAVQAGRSVDVVGPRGSGRTRFLLAVKQAVGGRQPVVWLVPSEDAFESLAPVVGPLSEQHASSIEVVRAAVERDVRRALADGAVLLADDAEQIDPASRSVLEACRDAGPIVRAFRREARPGEAHRSYPSRADAEDESLDVETVVRMDAITLAPLDEEHLRSLFAGPDRLLHLREDAARLLHLRTKGLPARVTEEITRWVRLGIAEWRANSLVVTREAIDALESGLLLAAPIDPEQATLPGLSATLADLLVWVGLAWPHTEPSFIARATGQPLFRIQAHLATLEQLGLVEPRAGGEIVPRLVIPAATRWTDDRVRAARDTLVSLLPLGATGRLAHLWARGLRSDDDRRAIAAEAAALAERLIDEGRLESATATLQRGLRQVRELGALAPEVAHLLSLWVVAAIEAGTAHALDRALYEIVRSEPQSDHLSRLEELCRAARAASSYGPRPLELIERVPRFEAPRLERARLSVLVRAARSLSDPPAEEAILREVTRHFPVEDADGEAIVMNHWGRLRYHQARYAESAALHCQAEGKARSRLVRMYSSLYCAFAFLDDLALESARDWAARAADLARSQRHAYCETLAEWTLRQIAYRQGTRARPDLELVEASASVGIKRIEGLIALNEAAFAFRYGSPGQAIELTRHAHGLLIASGEPRSVLVAQCLLARLEGASAEQVDRLSEKALSFPEPGLALQALALLAEAEGFPAARIPGDRALALADSIPREHWGKPMDVLSVEECLAALAAAGGRQGGRERPS
jgi:hypothetical protein